MKDFKSYSEGRSDKETNGKEVAGQRGGFSEGEATALAKKALSAYNGQSDVRLLAEIMRQAEASKRAGTLTNQEIDAFYAQFAPMLDEGARRKLKPVIERLKKI